MTRSTLGRKFRYFSCNSGSAAQSRRAARSRASRWRENDFTAGLGLRAPPAQRTPTGHGREANPGTAAVRSAQIRPAAQHRVLGRPSAHHLHRRLPAPVAAARAGHGPSNQALVLQLDAACRAADDLAAAAREAFAQHPDAEILTSFPGIGPLPVPGSWARSATTAPDSVTREG